MRLSTRQPAARISPGISRGETLVRHDCFYRNSIMISPSSGHGPLPKKAMTVPMMGCVLSISSALAYGDEPMVVRQKVERYSVTHHSRRVSASGTLGYGPPGVYPGFQGFGLGYHLGYGYGGDALGPEADGGYPFYCGPGYPTATRVSGDAGGSIRFPITAARAIPRPTTPITSGASPHWWSTSRSSPSPTIMAIVTMPMSSAPLRAGLPIPKPSSLNSRLGPRPARHR
jgi:hypothetical protein